ncbi:glycosyl hydrolase family 95 catalytic domain-containing protein [Pedobacter sp. KBW01]|uniref:glycosyl hydrolase family 95 catalytic domain-containing protein n=2 Tax=unclassified Pedobacter TaxID=2628915 RepID=UPI001319C474|nr:glycoside hydrolase N-terminal domain-containing protein [Pedobacter sp. KBW01]
MNKNLYHLKPMLLLVATLCAQTLFSQTKVPGKKWTAWSAKPALAWQDAFVTGNGKHGTMLTGNPGEERIICVHEELFIRAWDRHKVAVANISGLLPRVRTLADLGKFDLAASLSTDEARRQLTAMGAPQAWSISPHPAFDLNVKTESTGPIAAYRRELNMETGEAKSHWEDKNGAVEQSVFSSRANDVNVIRIIGLKGKKLNISLGLNETPGRKGEVAGLDLNNVFSSVSSSAEPGWLKYHASYSQDTGGYDGLARVTITGGEMSVVDNHLQIKNASQILIVMRITPLEYGSTSQEIPVRNELSALSPNYQELLMPHAKLHGEMFRRVVLDLGAGAQWLSTSTEKMLADAHTKGITPLFLEQMHAMGRYLLISSSGKYPPPLQGIWGGSWNPAWIGGFVMDSNVNLAISAISTGDLEECAESYFGYVERLLPAWRLNARNYLGCRGFLVPHYSDPEKGYLNHFGDGFPWMYWPGGAGWNLMPFYEHGMLYGNRNFLQKRVLPLYLEMAAFYEDYLTKEKDGFYHISPGISPENATPGSNTTLCKDATFDAAIAREVFDHLLKMGSMFNLDKTDMDKWKHYRDNIVPYRINADGALAEWIPAQYADEYAHRHNSHMYPIFPGTEFLQADADKYLLQGAKVALAKRFKSDTESAHGLIHLALMAARLHDEEKVAANLNRFAQRNYVYTGLSTSHNPNHAIYNLDSSLSLQRLLADMLVFSQPGRIELLPAYSSNLPDGKLSGVRIHGGHKLDLQWIAGKLQSAIIYAGANETCTFLYKGKEKKIQLMAGKIYIFNSMFQLTSK